MFITNLYLFTIMFSSFDHVLQLIILAEQTEVQVNSIHIWLLVRTLTNDFGGIIQKQM